MSDDKSFKAYIWNLIEPNVPKQPHYEVRLSTGDTFQGEISPLSKESDYIRFNPKDGGASYAIQLDHIVWVRRIVPENK